MRYHWGLVIGHVYAHKVSQNYDNYGARNGGSMGDPEFEANHLEVRETDHDEDGAADDLQVDEDEEDHDYDDEEDKGGSDVEQECSDEEFLGIDEMLW